MEKILLIGKINVTFQEINNYLSNYYDVKMCSDNYGMVKSMLEQSLPKVVVINMVGLDWLSIPILNELRDNYAMLPALCIGTDESKEQYEEYWSHDNFTLLQRTESNDNILQEIERLIKDGVKSADELMKEKAASNVKKTVLLVDDNAIQLRSLNDILKTKYNVMMATSGMKALTMLGKKIPDIIFLDYEMPVCDGKMTLEMIRQLEEAKDIPVVFLTGVKDKEHIKAVLELKPSGYLLKPASVDSIFGIIDKVIG